MNAVDQWASQVAAGQCTSQSAALPEVQQGATLIHVEDTDAQW